MQQAFVIICVVVAALFTRWMPHGPASTTSSFSTRLLLDFGLSMLLVVLCGIAAGGGLPRSPREDDGASRCPVARGRRSDLTALAQHQSPRPSTPRTSTNDVAA